MLPIIKSKTYYSDLSYEEVVGDSPPNRRDNVQGIVYYHEPPYRTLDYGHSFDNSMKWASDPTILLEPGDWLSDDVWEALITEMETK